MEKYEELIKLTRGKRMFFAVSWVLSGLYLITMSYLIRIYGINIDLLFYVFLVYLFFVLFNVATMFSSFAFLPKVEFTYWMVFFYISSHVLILAGLVQSQDWFLLTTPIQLIVCYIIVGLCLVYTVFFLIKKRIWFLCIPIVFLIIKLVLKEQLRDYIVNPVYVEIFQGALFILIGILFYRFDIKERKPFNTVVTVIILAFVIGVGFVGAMGRTWHWEGAAAKAEMERYLSVSLPDDADNMLMEYESNPKGPRKVHLMFETPTEGLEAFVAQGVLAFETDLDDFYTEKERSALQVYLHSSQIERENSDAAFSDGLIEILILQDNWVTAMLNDGEWGRFYFGRGDDDKYAVCQTGYPYNATYMMLIERSPREDRWIVDIYSFK